MGEDVVRAKRIELEDDNGEVCAILGPGSNGLGLIFFQTDEALGTRTTRVALGVSNEGTASINLLDNSQRGGTRIIVRDTGETAFYLMDEEGKRRMEISLRPYDQRTYPGQIGIYLGDKNEKIRVDLTLNNRGTMIGLADETGAKVAGLTLGNNGAPSLMLTDRGGEEQVRLVGPVPELGGSIIGVQDKQGKLRAFLSVDAEGEPSR